MQACLSGIGRAVVLAALLAGVGWTAAFAVEIEVLSVAKEEAPGSFVTLVFAVMNDGPSADTYLLSFETPPGWGVAGAPNSITTAAGAEETLFVTLTVPPDAPAGEHAIMLTATSQNDPTVTASSAALVIVTPRREIELLPPTGVDIAPGVWIEYEFAIINRGNKQDSLAIETSSSKALPMTLSHRVVDLAPQERATFRVRLDVPIGTLPGRDVLTVTATSTLYEGVEADAVVFTTVLPPGPESVEGTLMEVLPARVRLSFDKNVLTGAFSSRLTFSVSGQIKGGFFSSNLSLSDPIGPDRLELGSFSILYRRTPATYTTGNVSQRLTDLIRLSCLGGSVVIDEELFDLAIIGGGSNDETRFAGRLALGPEQVNFGVTYLGIRSPEPAYRSAWSATASAEPLEDWTIYIEGALGIDGSLTSRAFLFNTEIDTAGFFFSGAVFSVGTHFPGSQADTAGIETSYRLRLNAFSLSTSLQHVWDNVIGDPLVDTLIQDELGFNLATTPLEDGPTLSSTVEFAWDRYSDPTAKSEIDTLFAVSLIETDGAFPYAFSAKVTDQIDTVLDTHVRRSTFSEGAGLSVDSFYVFLQLTQEKQIDLVSDLVLSSAADVTVRFRPENSLHEASIAFGNTLDAFDLSASLYIRFIENLDIVFDGSVSWDRVDSSSVSFGWGVRLNASLELPIPVFVTKGQIEGRAFIDRNGDGIYSPDDRPLGGIIVAANGREASTNDEGLFRFTPFYAGTYTLTTRQLPVDAAAGEPVEVDLGAGQTEWVEIRVTPLVVVSGRIFDDRNQDGIADGDEGGFGQVRALLSNEAGFLGDTTTDLAGEFGFPGVLPGQYVVSFDAGTLPDRFTFTTSEQVTVDVGAEAPPPILFGGFVRPRDVIITFQPPTADFVYAPERPVAGKPIAFDGMFSFDFDGEIVTYEWDFDGDGAVDATSGVTEHTFPGSGTYEVSLTVTDDGGNSDTITLPIEVHEDSAAAPPTSVSTFQPPIADFSFMPAVPTPGEMVQFDGTLSTDFDGVISSYAWDFDGDGSVDETHSIVEHVFSDAGIHTVSLTVTDDSGNTDTVAIPIEVASDSEEGADVEASPGLPIAGFQHSPSEPVAGEVILFNGTSSIDPNGQIAGFAWDFNGDGQTDSTAPLAEHTFGEPGPHTVSLTVTDNDGNVDMASKTITARAPPGDTGTNPPSFQPPVADFAYMPASPRPGDLVLFDGTSSTDFDGHIVSYAWDFDGDGTTDSTGVIAEHTFAVSGTYSVSLTVTDNAGNTDSMTVSVDIE